MAAKVEASEKPAEPKPKPFMEPVERGVNADGLRWERVDVLGTPFTVREITVEEEDEAQDAAENPDGETWNTRLQVRMQLSAAIVDPPTSVDDIARWPGLKLRMVRFVFSRLNSLPPADAEGNA